MMGYYEEVEKSKKKIRAMSTSQIERALKEKRYNADGRRWAREELRSRGVFARGMGAKKKPARKRDVLGFGGFRF